MTIGEAPGSQAGELFTYIRDRYRQCTGVSCCFIANDNAYGRGARHQWHCLLPANHLDIAGVKRRCGDYDLFRVLPFHQDRPARIHFREHASDFECRPVVLRPQREAAWIERQLQVKSGVRLAGRDVGDVRDTDGGRVHGIQKLVSAASVGLVSLRFGRLLPDTFSATYPFR